jgi:hypothetical protein
VKIVEVVVGSGPRKAAAGTGAVAVVERRLVMREVRTAVAGS